MLTIKGTVNDVRPGGRPIVVQKTMNVLSQAVRIIDEDTIEVAGYTMRPTSMESPMDQILNDSGYHRILMILEGGRETAMRYSLRKEDDSILTVYETSATKLIQAYVREMLRTPSPIDQNHVTCKYINQARNLVI